MIDEPSRDRSSTPYSEETETLMPTKPYSTFCLFATLVFLTAANAQESQQFKTFSTNWEKAQQAFAAGDYQNAATCYENIIKVFPFEPTFQYHLACCQARQGLSDNALSTLEHAIICGWGDPKKLQEAEDFKDVRQQARFEKLLTEAETCQKELFTLYVGKGVDPQKPAPLVVVLHGLGSGPRSELPYWKSTADELGLVLIAPRGVTEIRSMFYGWHRTGAKDSTALDYFDVDAAGKRVNLAIDYARQRHTMAPGRVLLAGFSQGGGIALRLLGDHPHQFAGAVAVCSLCQSPGVPFWQSAATKGKFSIALLAGKLDRLLPRSQQLAEHLKTAGTKLHYHEWE